MGYNLDAIKKRIDALNNPTGKKASDSEQVKLKYWKPEVGETATVRFLPYNDGNGAPFQEIGYYNSKKLHEWRQVAPYQFGLPDPVHNLMVELRKERQKDDVWQLMKELRVKNSFYAPILVQGEEDKGVQVWEMSQRVVQSIYELLVHEDYEDEDLFDIQDGYDFTITAKDSGKKFNGYVIKDITVIPKRKSSPALKSKKACDELVKSIPNLQEVFKAKCMSKERLATLVDNFLNPDRGDEEGTVVTGDKEDVGEEEQEAKSKIDEAFDDIDF